MTQARTRLLLWRHGETDWNVSGRFQGQNDQPLNEAGRGQAARVAAQLAGIGVDAIYSSPSVRAVDTAQALADLTGLAVQTDPRLLEIHVGSWEGLYLADAVALDPGFGEAMRTGRDWRRSATGETSVETGERMGQCLRELAATHAGQTVVVASHGLAIRMGTANLLGWDYRTAIALASMHNCGWTLLVARGAGEWKLVTWNQAPLAGPR